MLDVHNKQRKIRSAGGQKLNGSSATDSFEAAPYFLDLPHVSRTNQSSHCYRDNPTVCVRPAPIGERFVLEDVTAAARWRSNGSVEKKQHSANVKLRFLHSVLTSDSVGLLTAWLRLSRHFKLQPNLKRTSFLTMPIALQLVTPALPHTTPLSPHTVLFLPPHLTSPRWLAPGLKAILYTPPPCFLLFRSSSFECFVRFYQGRENKVVRGPAQTQRNC